MTDFDIALLLGLCATFLIASICPRGVQLDVITCCTIFFLVAFSPVSAALMVTVVLFTYCITRQPFTARVKAVWGACFVIAILFALGKLAEPISRWGQFELPALIGLSYFLCRQIHLLVQSLSTTTGTLSLRQHFQYNFFLPVMLAGPIHRSEHFFRQDARRRIDSQNFAEALERILYGYSKVILGNFLIAHKLKESLTPIGAKGFTGLFIESACDWLYLYTQFSGWTDIALGFGLLLGFRLEENFRNPLAATTLIDFWQRWHITLSLWCRDYVYSPLAAATRNQFLALVGAMLVMGLWHQFSLYYVLWGVYQATGIALCRLYQLHGDPLHLAHLPRPVHHAITRTATFTWLISGMPILTSTLSHFSS